MPRVRLGAVIVVPEPIATEIEGLRRALGDPALDRVMPHVTLVPPVNVRLDDVGAALSVLRSAAAHARPMALELGPPRTFGPDSPTLYLPVGGDVDDLARLRAAVFSPPLHRTVDHDFVPHVTIAAELPTGRLAAAIDALADFRGELLADSLTLLEHVPPSAGRPLAAPRAAEGDATGHDATPRGRWKPIADARLGRPAVIGRGGIELELTSGSIPDPEALAMLAAADRLDGAADWFAHPAAHGVPPGARRVVVTARRRGVVVGVGWGHAWSGAHPGEGHGEIAAVVEAPDAVDAGVGRQLAMSLESQIISV